jgi:precorrin-6B methylase 2
MAQQAIEVPIKLGGLQQIKKELRELKGEIASATDPQEMQKLAQRAGELSDQLKDANEQVAVFATGSKFESTSNALGLMGSQIRDLDFDGAANSAKLFATSLKSITPTEMATQFKGLISIVGTMSKAFISFGATLLVNPIFIIGAIIAGIVAIIVALMSKLGLLKPVLNAIGKFFGAIGDAIQLVIQNIKDFLDWLGLTSFAEEEAAEKAVQAQEKKADAYKAAADKRVDAIDQEIRMAQLEGKNTFYLELEKQRLIKATAYQYAKSLSARISLMVASGDYDKKEVEDLQAKLKEQRKLISTSGNEISYIKKKHQVEEQKKEDEAHKKSVDAGKEANKKRIEAQKEYAKNRAEVARMIEDANIALMAEGEAKEIASINLKYKRIIEETEKNLKYTDDERKIIVKQLADQQAQELNKIEADKKAKEDARIQEGIVKEQETYNEFLARYEAQQTAIEDAQLTAEEREINAVRDKYFTLLEEAKKYGEDTTAIEEQIGQETAEIQKKYALKKIADAQAERDAKIQFASDVNAGLSQLGNIFINDQKKLEKFQKATALVQIAIDTAKAISSLVAMSQANPLNAVTAGGAGIAQYASGIVQILTNVAKAKALLSNPSSPAGGGGGGTSASATSSSSVTPSINMFGQGNNANNLTGQSMQSNQTVTVQAVVSETEITATQNKMKIIDLGSTL